MYNPNDQVLIHSRNAYTLHEPGTNNKSLPVSLPSTEHKYTLRGIDIIFPFPAYDCQLIFMERVIESLQTSSNALLESPTGTGKTLCLLCATLAWQKYTSNESNNESCNNNINNELELIQRIANKAGDHTLLLNASQPNTKLKPKIIYASRTHSQLAQVIKELKSTSYTNTRMSILGSRQQLCVNNDVNKLNDNSMINHSCQVKVTAKSCRYKENLINFSSHKQLLQNDIYDVEDLRAIGESNTICPYYYELDLRNDSELLLLPYNYLLDRNIRHRLNIQLENSVVIFDEAHNIESVSADSASFDLTSTQLAHSMNELDKLISDASNTNNVLNTTKGPLTTDELVRIKSQLIQLEQYIDNIPLVYSHSDKSYTGYTQNGTFIFDILSKCDISYENSPIVIDIIDRSIDYLMSDNHGGMNIHKKSSELDHIKNMLSTVYRHTIDSSMNAAQYYRVHIHAEINKNNNKQSSYVHPTNNDHIPKTLSYWCFYAGLTMNELQQCGVRSIMLASGTLSPLDSFAHELNLEFKIRLENPHVIKSEQVHIGILEKGPTNIVLNSSYQNRANQSYIDDLGNTIVNLCRTVPDGMLIFFASYTQMQVTIDLWQKLPDIDHSRSTSTTSTRQSVFDRIQKYKYIVQEPKHSNQFNDCIESYIHKLSDTTKNGCVMLAVCRGKISEGLDFSDRMGRCVVVCGIPVCSTAVSTTIHIICDTFTC